MGFACLQCILSYPDRESYLKHIKSDFHAYNLRRVNKNLLPVLENEYNERLDLIKVYNELKIRNKVSKHGRLFKATSVQHKEKHNDIDETFFEIEDEAKQNETASEETYILSNIEYNTTMSLFCKHVSDSFEENMKFMYNNYSLVIPDEKYCTNVEGLIQYLGEKVYEGLMCLYCNQQFSSFDSVLQHMTDKGHRRIGIYLDGQRDEYAYFYDYSTSYKDLTLPPKMLEALEKQSEDKAGADSNDNEDEVSWEEKLVKLGYKPPVKTENDNLFLALNEATLVNRRNLIQIKATKGRAELELSAVHKQADRLRKAGIDNSIHHSSSAREKKMYNKYTKAAEKLKLRMNVRSHKLQAYAVDSTKVFI